jgi:hypothetical protein
LSVPIVSVFAVSVLLLAGEHAAPVDAGGDDEPGEELELPQPDAASAKAAKAITRSFLIISDNLSKTWPRKRAEPTTDRLLLSG